MASSLFSKIAKFASSPQGKKAISQAKDFASKPENKAKIEQAAQKLRGKGKGGATPPR
ncbi:hypothetical protein RHODO2019_08275 [Rhodococcus antarcticus]|uniref:MT0933-like antitoxin protein n=1 Tax=Rhodococcus antarcticus TaxID=2987751 RepID=A0ABY6P539_9NOCA|nr:hypothetical protein [Rhodococcus antarcticus]UZJ26381.1 hypothetical protein RHODO2019_08275 [Rhodococcus antarcticus]